MISRNGTECLQCGVGQRVNSLSGSTECELCPRTHIGMDGICYQCDNGKQPDSVQGICQQCGAGAAGQGGKCVQCPPGTEPGFDSTFCRLCPAGLYKPPNAPSCITCWTNSIPTVDHTSCECTIGFQTSTSGIGCQDINECLVDNGGCDFLSECSNTVPGRLCGSCPPG